MPLDVDDDPHPVVDFSYANDEVGAQRCGDRAC
jgi:hypothetical protein